MSFIGLWPTKRRQLVAVTVSGDGRAGLLLRVPGTDEAAHALPAYLEAAHRAAAFQLLLPGRLGRSAPVALESGVSLWLVPDVFVDAVRTVCGLKTAPPSRTAAALARMPAASVFRVQMIGSRPTISRRPSGRGEGGKVGNPRRVRMPCSSIAADCGMISSSQVMAASGAGPSGADRL